MPKEVIHGSGQFLPYLPESVPGAPTLETEASEENPPVVVVGWDRETGLLNIVTRLKLAEVHGPSAPDTWEPIPVAYGYYVDMDRRGINDLIKVLRRARDSAFGRDE